MAGGKETPRQKMIGMMYLVLTALLALNVSKSILDAFVAIEENTQKANIVQVERGNSLYNDVKSEMATLTDADQKPKREKCEKILKQMDLINDETASIIDYIDKLKFTLLQESGEDVNTVSNNDPDALVWSKYDAKKDKTLPTRMNLMAVQAKDQYDVPMHLLIGDDIKKPSGEGVELWDRFRKYRNRLVEVTGTYDWTGKKYSIKPEHINDFADNKDLVKKVNTMLEKSNANLVDDKERLAEIYIALTKKEKNTVHDVKDVHWIGATFDHSPLVAAIASLSSLQQDILSARAIALDLLKSKVTVGEFNFNTVMEMAVGPAVVNEGEDVELKVMMVAFDSDNQPKVELTEGNGEVSANGQGQGLVKFKAGSGTTTLKGTVAIKNKSGQWKERTWEHTVQVMKPSGSIELTEMNMLYRGYDNKVEATASGYPETILTGQNATVSRSGSGYVVRPGSGSEAFLTVSGRSVDGKTAQLKRVKYRVSMLPPPSLYWGSAESGNRGSSSNLIQAKYPSSVPLNAQFRVVGMSCSAPGLRAAPPTSASGTITPQMRALINAAPSGSQISYIVKVRDPAGILRQIPGVWTKP